MATRLFWNQPPTLEEAGFFSSPFSSFPLAIRSTKLRKKGLLECNWARTYTNAFTYLYTRLDTNTSSHLFFFFDEFLLECNVRLV